MGKIFVEGLPGAGKSTLLNTLNEQGIPVIDEIGHTIDQSEFPGNGSSIGEILDIDTWFINMERRRMQGPGVYDRSYHTHLTYSYAYSHYTGLDAFPHTVAKYAEAIDQRVLDIPHGVLYVEASPELSITRQLLRIQMGGLALDNFWRDKQFLSDLVRAYDALFESTEGIDIVRIDADASTESLASSLVDSLHESLAPVSPESHTRAINLGSYVSRLRKGIPL